jgi:PAS domain S-box-containing protein
MIARYRLGELASHGHNPGASTDREGFYRTILEDMPDLVCRWRPDGTITYVNRNYCEYFGKQIHEFLGHTFLPAIPPEDQALVAEAISKLGDGVSTVTVQHRVILPGGEIRWHEWTNRPLLDGRGNLLEIQSTGRDITERTQKEEKLRLADLVIRRSPTVVFRWRIAPDWPVVFVSDNVTQWGYTAAELVDGRTPFLSLIPGEDIRRVTEEISDQLAAGIENFPTQYRLLTKSGEERWVEEHSTIERDADGKPAFIQGIVSDITARRRDDEALEARTRRAAAAGNALNVLTMSPALAAGEVERFAQELTEQVSRATGVERVSVWLFDDSETLLECIDLYESTPARHSAGMSLVESQYAAVFEALKTAEYVDASDALSDPRTSGYRDGYLRPLGITSMLDAVISVSGKHLGTVCLEHVNRRHQWQPDEMEFACRLGDKVGLALINRGARMARMQWQAGLEQTVRAIANTVELRDPYTAGHQARVAQLCEAIGHELGLPEERIRGLSLAAVVHDVGKVRIPADILNKPRALNSHEVRIVQTHSEAGYEILKDVHFPWPIAEIVLQHHERLDGSGYPRALKGDEILLEARIIAVADVVEAMSSHRPFRPALGIETALAEIEAKAGTQYDEAVVKASLRVFRDAKFCWD